MKMKHLYLLFALLIPTLLKAEPVKPENPVQLSTVIGKADGIKGQPRVELRRELAPKHGAWQIVFFSDGADRPAVFPLNDARTVCSDMAKLKEGTIGGGQVVGDIAVLNLEDDGIRTLVLGSTIGRTTMIQFEHSSSKSFAEMVERAEGIAAWLDSRVSLKEN
jgi:hypothetical protein